MTLLAVGLASTTAPQGALSRSQELKAKTFEKMTRGIKAVRDGQPKLAIGLLEEVTGVALNSFRAFYYLGMAYKKDRQYMKAIPPFTFALDLDPTHTQAHVELGDCYLKRGDIGEALAEYHRALEIQQGFAPAWDGLGRAAEASGDDDAAVAHFTKAIDLNPGFPDAPLNLGDLYLRAGRLREAVDLFLKAIAVRPDFAAAFNRLGVAYARQRLGNEAIAALRKAADLERGNPWHPYTIGTIELDLGYLGRALRSFEAAIRLDSSYLEAWLEKALIFRRLGRLEEAEYLLEAAGEQPTEDVAILKEIASLREELRRERLTIEDIEARTEGGMATLDEIRTLAELRASAGDFESAARALSGARERDTSITGEGESAGQLAETDLFRLGYYQLRAGSFDEAAETFTRLRAERPDSPAVLLNLGLSLEGKGFAGAAVQVYRDALGRRPDDPVLLSALGNVLVSEERYEEAIRAFEEALAVPAEFSGRVRVETILRALREMHGAGGTGKRDGAP